MTQMEKERLGANVLAEMLSKYDVSHVFYMPCLAVRALAELEDLGVRRVVAHSEKAAAYMADGFARASGRPGVCLSQHIGASNLAAGLRDAYLAGSPVIALSGGPEPSTRFRHGYQDVEDVSQFENVTKASSFIDTVDRLPDLVRQSFRAATTGAPGPVHLGFRGRIGQVVDEALDDEGLVEKRFSKIPAFRPHADPQDILAAVAELKAAKRPVIVAGGGIVSSGAESELLALAEATGIPVITSLNAKHVIADGHPLSLGVSGTYSRACANKALLVSDLVFFIGSHTGGQVTFNWQTPPIGAPVVQLDIDASELGRNYPNRASINGDAKVSLAQLLTTLGDDAALLNTQYEPWRKEVDALRKDWWESVHSELISETAPMRPERLCAEISNNLPSDAILVSDTGHAGIWSGVYIELRSPGQRYIRCAGSMGWGFPGALGVKCAEPNRPVFCFTGDGAFYYHLPELETAVRYNINVITIVNNNSALSQEMPGVIRSYGNELRGRGREMFTFENTDFAALAENFGCLGIRVENPADIGAAMERALKANRPVIIDVVTDIDALPQKPFAG